MAQESALREVADSKLRRLPAYAKNSTCADVENGDSVLLYKAPNRGSHPKWGCPVYALDIDETRVSERYQSQTLEVVRYCARGRVDAGGVDNMEGRPGLEPSCGRPYPLTPDPACACPTLGPTKRVVEHQVAP